ncbi:MAG: CBS domain-containing protein [Deltaproteobacteria bacterium]|nr:CBS domain-containing protein [Deltaproteobacteria bacterium]
MLVGKRMSRNPVTVNTLDNLSTAKAKMRAGNFRRLPILEEGKLVGIVTEGDIREHVGNLERTEVKSCMTEGLLTVTPQTTLEEAATLLLNHKIGGLPVLEEGRLVGIITTSDVLQAFLDVMGASEPGTARIDLLLEGEETGLADASKTIVEEGGEILGVGTYRERWGESPVCYLRVRASDLEAVTRGLRKRGYNILGLHV